MDTVLLDSAHLVFKCIQQMRNSTFSLYKYTYTDECDIYHIYLLQNSLSYMGELPFETQVWDLNVSALLSLTVCPNALHSRRHSLPCSPVLILPLTKCLSHLLTISNTCQLLSCKLCKSWHSVQKAHASYWYSYWYFRLRRCFYSLRFGCFE